MPAVAIVGGGGGGGGSGLARCQAGVLEKGTKQIDAMNESRGGLSVNTVGKGLGEACACPMVFRYCKGRVIVGCCSRWQR